MAGDCADFAAARAIAPTGSRISTRLAIASLPVNVQNKAPPIIGRVLFVGYQRTLSDSKESMFVLAPH